MEKNMKTLTTPTSWAKIGIISVLVACSMLWYVPYYQNYKSLYDRYNFVWTQECLPDKFHPKVQHNVMTYDGIPTNCSHAKIFVDIPVFIGAFNAMWEGSVFYTLLHATTWQVQAAYILFAALIVYLYFKRYMVSSVLHSIQNNKPQQQHHRVIVPIKKEQPSNVLIEKTFNPLIWSEKDEIEKD